MVYAWSQANAGVSFSLFDKPTIAIPHLQGIVIPKIRKFLSKINAKITLDTAYISPKLQSNDIAIMDKALTLDLTKNQIQQVNAVLEYYNVMLLSEICNAEGTSIRRGALEGTESLDANYTVTRQFPKQNRPNSYSWKFWKKVLSTFTVTDHNIEQSHSLGYWTEHHSTSGI